MKTIKMVTHCVVFATYGSQRSNIIESRLYSHNGSNVNFYNVIIGLILNFAVMFPFYAGILATKVSINQTITGFVGNKNTQLTCSFFLGKGEKIFSVQIIGKNLTEDFDYKKPIAIFKPEEASKIHTSAEYLLGRVTLSNISTTSLNASLTFSTLKCKDEKYYMCKLFFFDMDGDVLTGTSQTTTISVKAPPSRPDSISSIIMRSSKTKKHGRDSSQFIRKMYNFPLNTTQNGLLFFQKYPIDTTVSTNLQNTHKPTKFLREGDTIIFTCTGNIGKPPGKLVWQKIFPQQNEKRSIIYSNETTVIEELPDKCSFRGTINLTVIISAEDLNAHFRCFEESQADFPEMYVETSRLDIHFQIRHVNVNKQPNQKQYDRKTDQINLTCTAMGNPEPKYIWFKQDNMRNILSRTNTFVIGEKNPNNSGIYTCEAFNIIDNVIYKKSYSVAIDIVDKLMQTTDSELMKIFAVHAAYAISFTCTVVVVVLCYIVKKRYGKKEKRNIPSEVSVDQENISLNNEYEEIENVSFHAVNLHDDRIENNNQTITEEDIVLENIPIPTYTSSNENNITFSYLYVNTDIFNTNENRKVADNHETISGHSNRLGNCQIGVDNAFDSDNSGSDTLHVNQYVNTTSLRVPNVYEDLNHTTVNTHKYENPHIEGDTTCTG